MYWLSLRICVHLMREEDVSSLHCRKQQWREKFDILKAQKVDVAYLASVKQVHDQDCTISSCLVQVSKDK